MRPVTARLRAVLPKSVKREALRLGDIYWERVGRVAKRVYAQYYVREREQTWENTYWLGAPLLKLPSDLWIYQEIMHEIRPVLIVETGTYRGGSALYMASIMDLLNRGRVLTIDVNPQPNLPTHPRIEYLAGSSIAPETIERVKTCVEQADGPVLIILDSDHRRDHVLAELAAYHSLVTPGSYLIVEDTAHNGHPVLRHAGPGPWEAVELFLSDHPEFTPDADREKFMVTWNPRGFLKRS